MRASKYIKLSVLLDENELIELMETLGPIKIFEIGKVAPQIELSCEQFLHNHCSYLQKLQNKESCNYPLSVAFTTDEAAISIQEVGERKLARLKLPVVQLQPATVRYSQESKDFQIGVFGEGISWGIQFSYPFLFQDEENQIWKVDDTFPNTELFLKLQRFVRKKTKATPFNVGQKKINVPVRLGLNCFSWINQHPDFKGVSVAT